MRAVRESGWPVVWIGGRQESADTCFAYVEPPGSPAAVIEIMELTEVTAATATFVREAATGWDGDPIRELAV